MGRPVVSRRFDGLGADGADVRLGLLGGTFDPIHIGHLICAEQVRSHAALDAVLFIPARNPSFKQGTVNASIEDRLAMCEAATRDNPCFDVSDVEAARSGVTYTVDTLGLLHDHYPDNVELCFILGADALASLPKWYQAEELARLATFIGVRRPGSDIGAIRERVMGQDVGFNIQFADMPLIDVSSTDIRRRVGEGRSTRYLVTDEVRAYIESHGLYRKG